MISKIIGAVLFGSFLLSAGASAQEWPTRPITIVLPTAAGGTADALVRSVADKVSKRLGQPIIIENKGGASGIVGLQASLQRPADGYTFVVGWPSSIVATQFLVKELPFNAKRDFVPVSMLSVNEMVMVVSSAVPATNLDELVAWAKQNKGKVSYGSYGTGTFGHMATAHFSKTLGLDAVHVPYKGEAPMLLATAGNEVAFSIGVAPAAKRLQDTGKVRLIAITNRERSTNVPDVPTFIESGYTDPAFSVAGWYGLFAPAGTPQAAIDRMEKEVMAVMRLPETQESLSALGMPLIGSTAEELGEAWDSEIPIYKTLIESAGVTPS